MQTHSFLIFVIMLAIISPVKLCDTDPKTHKIKFLTTVEGKSYFADQAEFRNWTTAGEFCHCLGMALGTISTATQAEAILLAYDSIDFAGVYWTAGRDSQDLQQFTWNGTSNGVTSNLIDLYQYPLEYQTCLSLWSLPRNTSVFVYQKCSDMVFGTICETFL